MYKKSNAEVTPFGGIYPIHDAVINKNIPALIQQELGQRKPNAVYSYSDLILNRCYTAFCGGSCAEDTTYIQSILGNLKKLKTPSPDTILRMETELSVPTQTHVSDEGVTNQININSTLNSLLIKTAVHLGLLKSDAKELCMDFDHQFIPTNKYDTAYSYKKERGYFPGVASIDNIPVYIEGRNGNSSVKYEQLETLKRTKASLNENGISFKRVRMDSGSYIKEVCNWLAEADTTFFIRAAHSEDLLFEASLAENWRKISLNHEPHEVCSIEYTFGNHSHRMVCYRRPNKSGQINSYTADANNYQFIITNDSEWDEETIIRFYNARGNAERLFDIQNNDFNWTTMPYSFLHQNTTYLIIMAICNVLYQWICVVFAKICDFIQPGQRLKKFRYRLICIAAKVTRSGRQKVTTFFTKSNINFKALSP